MPLKNNGLHFNMAKIFHTYFFILLFIINKLWKKFAGRFKDIGKKSKISGYSLSGKRL